MSHQFPLLATQVPGSVIRQRIMVDELLAELAQSPISKAGAAEGELVLRALRYAAALKDPIGFVNFGGATGSVDSKEASGEVFAWTMFQSVLKILQQFEVKINHYRALTLTNTVLSQY